RVAEVAQATGSRAPIQAMLKQANAFFASPHSWIQDDVRRQLRPLRPLLRVEGESALEANRVGWGWFYLFYVRAFFDNPLDRYAYLDGLFDRLDRAETPTRPVRVARQVIMLFDSDLPVVFYRKQLDHPAVEIRYSAHWRLAQILSSAAERRRHEAAAAELLYQLLAATDVIAQIGPQSWIGGGDRYLLRSAASLLERFPDKRETAIATIEREFGRLLERGQFGAFFSWEPERFLPHLSPEQQWDLFQKGLAWRDRGPKEKGRAADEFAWQFGRLERLNQNLVEQHFPERADPNQVEPITLLEPGMPEWQRVAAGVYRKSYQPKDQALTPQRMFLEGTTLWVAMGCAPPPGHTAEVGLLQLDLATGKILSFRHGVLDARDPSAGQYHTIRPPITFSREMMPLCRWKNYIAVPKCGAGVFLFPDRPEPGDHSLRGVTVLDRDHALPNVNISCVAGLGDDLYIGLNQTLVRWSPGAKTTELVANFASALAEGQPGPGVVRGLVGVEERQALYGLIRTGHDSQLWCWTPATKAWRKVLTYRIAFPAPSVGPYGSIDDWARILTPDNHLLQIEYFNKVWAEMDVRAEKMIDAPPALPVFTLPRDTKVDYDVMNYENGTLLLVGHHSQWKLLFSKRASLPLPATLAWAARQPEPVKTITVRPPPPPQIRYDGYMFPWSFGPAPTPLARAAAAGQTAELKKLIAGGAELDAANDQGETALMYAIVRGHPDCVRLLVEAGANVSATTAYYQFPLMFAAGRAEPDILELLLDKGASPNDETAERNTALHLAAKRNHLGNVRVLLRHGADPTIADTMIHHTPMMEAPGDSEVRLLLEQAIGEWLRAKSTP
ncbi:ankyrin repeat domain-containing protein, partial [bacterium]|nr:ankyrin repeat domain-containing protein [bacterium]